VHHCPFRLAWLVESSEKATRIPIGTIVIFAQLDN
jgi:hypothetical protein